MPKFRRKFAPIDAIQFTGLNTDPEQLSDFFENAVICRDIDDFFVIHTSTQSIKVEVGDWIVQEFKGDFRCYKPNIFTELYEVVNIESFNANLFWQRFDLP